MQIVIDIPEEIITDIKDYCGMSIADAKKALPIILNAIHNGTPLPKGHGRLIDAGEIIGKIHGVRSITAVLDAPTIIEAD